MIVRKYLSSRRIAQCIGRAILLLIAGLLVFALAAAVSSAEQPTVNLPASMRQENWKRSGQGSCCHATLVSLFRWQGRPLLADYWRRTYGGGEWISTLATKLDAEQVQYAYTSKEFDIEFLEWACRTRRGALVMLPSTGCRHAVAIVYMDQQSVALLDNNRIEKYRWMKRDEFLRQWKRAGSDALTPVYSPAPPLPGGQRGYRG